MRQRATRLKTADSHISSDVHDWFAGSALFEGLNADDLAKFAAVSTLRSYEALEEAIVEGHTPRALNLVVAGRFILLLPAERITRFVENAMVNLDCYVAGDTFGEAALAAGKTMPAPASVVATERSQVVSLSRRRLEQVIGEDSRIAHVVYRNLFGIQTRRLRVLADLGT